MVESLTRPWSSLSCFEATPSFQVSCIRYTGRPSDIHIEHPMDAPYIKCLYFKTTACMNIILFCRYFILYISYYIACGVGSVWCSACGAGSVWCRQRVVQAACGAGNVWCRQRVVQAACGASSVWCRQLAV